MSRRAQWLVGTIAVTIAVALAFWIGRSIEWVDVTIPLPAKGEAARDEFHAAKQIARRLDISERTVNRHWICARTWLFKQIESRTS